MMTKGMILLGTLLLSGGVGASTLAPTEARATTEFEIEAVAAADGSGTIQLKVTGFQSSDGKAVAVLYNRDNGFPTKGGWKKSSGSVSGGVATISFSVPHGEYAISCYHDENGNGELDTNWLGIPKEGVCASNNAKGRMGPPDYEDAAFSLSGDTHVQNVKLAYL